MSDRASSQQDSGLAGQVWSDFHPVVFDGFEGLDTKANRASIGDKKMSLCDGWMPVAPDHLLILPGTGPTVTTLPPTVLWFGFGNISDLEVMIVLGSDGSIIRVDPVTGGQVTIAPIGTITTPSSAFGFSQWGSQYLLFCKDQTNGYWIWDGTTLFTAGGVAPEAILTSSGSDYTSVPTITSQTTGSGTGDTYLATIENNAVTRIQTTSPGSGYAKDDLISLRITGGGSDDQALPDHPTVSLTSGGLDEVYVINGGNAYTGRVNVTISGGGGAGASISLAVQAGTIVGAAVVQPGNGYTSAPTLTINDPGIPGTVAIPGGTGGQIGCSVSFGQITAINMINGGTNYVSAPIVHILGDGTGATAVAIIAGGAVTNILMKMQGKGYTRALAVLEGGNDAANALHLIMPWGISGTSIETYQQRAWVTNGGAVATFPPKNRTIFSAPSSPWDFGDGGGAFRSTDSFLRIGYHALRQCNGFLWLLGDSSLNSISGVTTTTPSGQSVSAIPITNFGNQNTDPQVGSPWPSSVQVFGGNVVFANPNGIYVSYSGAVKKVSDQLDGFYQSVPAILSGADFSSAIAQLFNKPVYMLLLPVIRQATGQQVNQLLMYDGERWFVSLQDRTLTYIATQEVNSQIIAWGTDGHAIFKLFQTPSTGFTKYVQSKLKTDPSYMATKTAISMGGVLNANAVDQPLQITIDTEAGAGTGNAAVSVLPSGIGLNVFGPLPVGQQGRMLGFTVTTTASNMALVSLAAFGQTETMNV
jgi:hypothetical protein